MIEVKKMIPAVAASGMALVGCESDVLSPQDVINNFCAKMVDCSMGDEADLAECHAGLDDFAAQYDDLVEEYGAECINAYLGIFNCMSSLTCEELEDEGA